MSILSILATNNFITVNRTVASIVGLEAAVIFGELAGESQYWQEHNPEADGWFFSTVENLEKRTFLSAHQQRQAIQKLEEQGWIETEKKGMPAKRYIRMKEEKIIECLNDKTLKFLTTSDEKNEPQDVQKFNDNKNNIKENIKREKRESKKTPTVVHPEKKNIEKIIDTLMTVYPYSKNKIDRETAVEIWLEAFHDVKTEDLLRAIKNHIKTSPYYPTITEIEEQLRRIYLTTTTTPEKNNPVSQNPDDADDRIERLIEIINIEE